MGRQIESLQFFNGEGGREREMIFSKKNLMDDIFKEEFNGFANNHLDIWSQDFQWRIGSLLSTITWHIVLATVYFHIVSLKVILFFFILKKKKDFLFPCSGVLTQIILFLYLLESYLTNTYWRWMGMEHIWSCGAPRKFSWESYYNFFFFFLKWAYVKDQTMKWPNHNFRPFYFLLAPRWEKNLSWLLTKFWFNAFLKTKIIVGIIKLDTKPNLKIILHMAHRWGSSVIKY